ncbi:MAG: hypothetical protein GFH24_608346n21 [Chloroflexi bacterium AL-N5]|nr:hypothetical protein [Chloroflexi bacterium AL-N5]
MTTQISSSTVKHEDALLPRAWNILPEITERIDTVLATDEPRVHQHLSYACYDITMYRKALIRLKAQRVHHRLTLVPLHTMGQQLPHA